MQRSEVSMNRYLSGVFLEDRPVSKRVFNLVIGLVLIWGFSINYLAVAYFPVEILQWINPWVLLAVVFASLMAGCLIMLKYPVPLISFLGYNLMTLSISITLSLFLQGFTAAEVALAVEYTAGITLLMIITATIVPKLFVSFGKVLCVVGGWIVSVELTWLLFFGQSHDMIHLIAALSMCGYIGYTWAVACEYGETLDEAIDFGGMLYVHIINLFMRLLHLIESLRS
ncbi:Bax inhibitor-1 family protein [Shewanella sp. 0m-4]